MNRTLSLARTLGVIGVLTLGLGACGGDDEPDTAAPAADEGAASTDATSGDSVTIDDLAFEPESLEVEVGATVTWTNAEGTPHTVTSSDDVFDSENMPTDETFEYTFDEAGEFPYVCEIHPSMEGTVVVE